MGVEIDEWNARADQEIHLSQEIRNIPDKFGDKLWLQKEDKRMWCGCEGLGRRVKELYLGGWTLPLHTW